MLFPITISYVIVSLFVKMAMISYRVLLGKEVPTAYAIGWRHKLWYGKQLGLHLAGRLRRLQAADRAWVRAPKVKGGCSFVKRIDGP